MKYTAVIRTLGKGGEKYQILLDSLIQQTIQPVDILVYIAEGYELPKETVGCEKYIYVKKGMVAQRALQYKEVTTEYCLFLDDDVYLPCDGVEKLFFFLKKYEADVISPDVFFNAERPAISKLMMAVSGRMWPRYNDKKYGYKVLQTGGYSYNVKPSHGIYLSQTNAGPCFLCKKDVFLKIHFEDEVWLDQSKYALGEDQVMFYKMYLLGFKQLTYFNSGIKHLDAGTTLQNKDKAHNLIYADLRFKVIFWHRFIFLPEKSFSKKVRGVIYIGYMLLFTLIVSLLKLRYDILKLKWKAINDGVTFIKSKSYSKIPLIVKKIK